MLSAIMTMIRRAFARSTRINRDRDQTRRVRALVMGARAEKLRTIAFTERTTVADIDDALDMLVQHHQITRDEALLLVERSGLARTQEMLDAGA